MLLLGCGMCLLRLVCDAMFLRHCCLVHIVLEQNVFNITL